jgi:endonuclease III
MASQRIPYNTSLPLGAKFQRLVRFIVSARQEAEELNRQLQKFIDDEAAIANESGIALAKVAEVRSIISYVAGELGGVTELAVPQGGKTWTRDLADAMG